MLEQTLRIVVRELEMAGAAFPSVGLAYGNVKDLNLGNGSGSAQPMYLLQDREGRRMTELVVAPPDGRELTVEPRSGAAGRPERRGPYRVRRSTC